MLIETFIRKQLRLKAHRVTKVETKEESMVIHIDQLGKRKLRCGFVGSHADACIACGTGGSGGICPCESCIWFCATNRAGKMRAVWRAGGGFPLGRAVGASDSSLGQCGSQLDTGAELARHSAALCSELEDSGGGRAAGGALWPASSQAAAGTQDWHR